MNLNKKNILKDFIINILASGIVTMILQVIIYPVFGQKLDIEMYGMLLTTMGLVNVIASALGNSLNNVRLLKNNNYSIKGDFNILLLFSVIFSLIVSFLLSLLVFKYNMYMSLTISFLTALSLIRQYIIVTYRINLDFKSLLINNIFISIGYIIGLFISLKINNWVFAFLMGELFGVLHCVRKSKLIFEPYKKTDNFSDTFKSYLHLIISILFGQSMLYMDRFIILPFLGSEMVSIYTVATFAGKTLGIVALPISSVLLSYYTKKSFVFTKKKLNSIFLMIMLISAISLLVVQIACPYVLPILYPKIYKYVIPYLLFANIGAILNISSNILQPAIMKICKTKYQIYIQLVFILTFFVCSYIFLKRYGLYAICLSMILANVVKIIFMMIIGYKSLSAKQLQSIVHDNS